MAWIESHQALRSHPKTLRLARELQISRAAAIGHLHCLWWWAVDYAPDGDLSRHDPVDVAIGAEWDGDAEAFQTALRTSKFVNDKDVLHDWMDYAGRLIERRKADADRKRQARSDSRPEDVQRTRRGSPEDGARTDPTDLPTEPTDQDQEQGAPHFLVAKYLDKLKAEPGGDVWTHVDPAAITDAGADFGLDALAVGQVLGDVWLWWRDATPSKRWKKQPLRGLRTWIRRGQVKPGEAEADPDAERLEVLPGKLADAIRAEMADGVVWPVTYGEVDDLVVHTLTRFPDGSVSELVLRAFSIAKERA